MEITTRIELKLNKRLVSLFEMKCVVFSHYFTLFSVDYCTIERELESTPTEECQEDSSVYFTPQQQQQQQQTKEHDDTLHV